MKQIGDTIGGWMWYVAQVKAVNPTVIIDYKMLMQQYIRGIAPSSTGVKHVS